MKLQIKLSLAGTIKFTIAIVEETKGVADELDRTNRGSFLPPTSLAPTMPLSSTTVTVSAGRSRNTEVIQYVTQQLETLWPSMNKILAEEYSTPDHARRLVHYYQQRPHLASFTLEKELERMKYQVSLEGDDNTVLTDAMEIADYFQEQHPPSACQSNDNDRNQDLICSANQSLLADFLHALTGPNRLIKPQHSTSCSATQCQFQLNMKPSNVSVTCHADFEMSIPFQADTSCNSTTLRLVIATFSADIVFQPSVPMIQYHISELNVKKHLFSWNDDW